MAVEGVMVFILAELSLIRNFGNRLTLVRRNEDKMIKLFTEYIILSLVIPFFTCFFRFYSDC